MNASTWLEAARWVASKSGERAHLAIKARRDAPCVWAEFHAAMLDALPRRRVAARAWHQLMRRRMVALCKAKGGPCRG